SRENGKMQPPDLTDQRQMTALAQSLVHGRRGFACAALLLAAAAAMGFWLLAGGPRRFAGGSPRRDEPTTPLALVQGSSAETRRDGTPDLEITLRLGRTVGRSGEEIPVAVTFRNAAAQ